MALCHRVAFPVRRVWLAVAARVKARKEGGILKLRDDVQTCGYQDVQVMWEILRRSEMKEQPKEHKRSFWRMPKWSNKTSSCASEKDQEQHSTH
ncbi:hypothetical protein J5N97_002556 [Dioscorea zingiberensis]|uniref:Uncharacterized protein n=1 Tax=Dioscorea zingiberensis TaxID=325984 RepID=A0A9D5D2E9_9LILI|nr:hypothetical protein J5N97_002556 [Dioscorea zingiberensis]